MGGVFIRDIAEWTVVVGLPESVLEHFSNPTVARQVFAEPSAFSYGLSFQSFVGGIPVDHVQGVFIQSVALNPSFLGLTPNTFSKVSSNKSDTSTGVCSGDLCPKFST